MRGHFFIGPILKIREIKLPFEASKLACVNGHDRPSCYQHSFCSDCGQPLVEVKYQDEREIEHEDFRESLDGLRFFYHQNTKEFRGHLTYTAPKVERPYDYCVKLTDLNPSGEIAAFIKTYKSQIKAAGDLVGPENVSVVWRITSCSS